MDSTLQNRDMLLIEGDPALRDALGAWVNVTFPSFHLTKARDCAQGLSASRSRSPDVVLVDISRLGRGGAQAIARVAAAHPAAVIIALVANDHSRYRRDMLAAGAKACASTWRLGAELLPTLQRVLSSQPAVEKVEGRS